MRRSHVSSCHNRAYVDNARFGNSRTSSNSLCADGFSGVTMPNLKSTIARHQGLPSQFGGHGAEPVIGPRFARTRWRLCPAYTASILGLLLAYQLRRWARDLRTAAGIELLDQRQRARRTGYLDDHSAAVHVNIQCDPLVQLNLQYSRGFVGVIDIQAAVLDRVAQFDKPSFCIAQRHHERVDILRKNAVEIFREFRILRP